MLIGLGVRTRESCVNADPRHCTLSRRASRGCPVRLVLGTPARENGASLPLRPWPADDPNHRSTPKIAAPQEPHTAARICAGMTITVRRLTMQPHGSRWPTYQVGVKRWPNSRAGNTRRRHQQLAVRSTVLQFFGQNEGGSRHLADSGRRPFVAPPPSVDHALGA